MDITQYIQPGLRNEIDYKVEDEHTAAHLGSGTLRVLATPAMILFMERIARLLLDEHLPEGFTSVGVHVDIRHLAPSPAGSVVSVRCEVLKVKGWEVYLSAKARDKIESIGEGTHKRVVIDKSRFFKRVEAKSG